LLLKTTSFDPAMGLSSGDEQELEKWNVGYMEITRALRDAGHHAHWTEVTSPCNTPGLIIPFRTLQRPHSNLRVSDLFIDIQLYK
jgi:hypothetical protein